MITATESVSVVSDRFDYFRSVLRSRKTSKEALEQIEIVCEQLNGENGFNRAQLDELVRDLGELVVQHQSRSARMDALSLLEVSGDKYGVDGLQPWLVLRELAQALEGELRREPYDEDYLALLVKVLNRVAEPDGSGDFHYRMEMARTAGKSLLRCLNLAACSRDVWLAQWVVYIFRDFEVIAGMPHTNPPGENTPLVKLVKSFRESEASRTIQSWNDPEIELFYEG